MEQDRQRLDLWIWHARCVRSRANSAALVKAGRVRVNGQRVTSPGYAVRIGDTVTVALDARVRVLRITGLAGRRGDAEAARSLHMELDPPAPDADRTS